MTRTTTLTAARSLRALLLSASAMAIAGPASAADVVFSTERGLEVEDGERTSQARGLTQIRLESGAILSFVDRAEYRINADGTVELYAGSVTVAGNRAETMVRMPAGIEGRVGAGQAASFSVAADGTSRGHALTGTVSIAGAGVTRTFQAGEMWAADERRLRQVASNGAQATPETASEVQVADMQQGGPVAAAANGVPVSLGDALAAAGASGDVLAAARRVEVAAVNPAIGTFPTGDVALLLSYAAELQNAYGGQAFPGAQADVIRAYLGYLADGGSGAQFLTVYSGLLVQYLDLLRAGALPSAFEGASLADLHAFVAYAGRTSGFGGLSAQNRALVEAYLAFLTNNGNADAFVRSYTDLVGAYFAFLRHGGDPLAFQGASQQTLAAYIAFLSQSGLAARLSQADQALLQAYLANGGLAFAGQYRAALDAYFRYLAAGNLPSGYAGLDVATVRAYLQALRTAGLFDQVLGAQAEFYAGLLAHLDGGGAIDAYAGLNANLFASYAAALDAYYEYLLLGGLPSGYTALSQQQIAAYLAALQGAGASGAFLDELAEFYAGYLAHLGSGGNPDLYTGLPVVALPAFAEALNAYAAFLAGGGLPSGYTAVDRATLMQYLAALERSGQLAALLGDNADLIHAYFAYLGGGGDPDRFAGLPVYGTYAAAIEAYYAYLAAGGLPADYTALSQAQIQAYLAALSAAGGFDAQLGNLSEFFEAYYAFVAGGGNPANFGGLPVYDSYLAALQAYFEFLSDGGLPSAYTALTEAQIRAYLEALQAAGVLQAELTADSLQFVLAYLSYVQSGADPDQFEQLPGNVSQPSLAAGANVWIFSTEGVRAGSAPTASVSDAGQITRVDYATAPNSVVTYDYSGAGNALREHGRLGDSVAWTRYDRGNAGAGITNQSVHLLLGSPATNLPASGTVDYKLIGGTAPTNAFAAAGEAGSFTGNLSVAFGATPKVGLDFDVHVGLRGWHGETAGGAAGAASGGLAVGTAMRFESAQLAKSGIAGNACTQYCNVSVYGGLFGPGANSAGFQYFIDDQSSGGRSYVNGTAVFGTSGTELERIGTLPSTGSPGGETDYSGGFNGTRPYFGWVLAGRNGFLDLVGGETGFATGYVLEDNGQQTSLTRDSFTRTRGTAVASEVYGNANALIQRWHSGTTGGFEGVTLSANQGAHILMLRPTAPGFSGPTSGRIDYYLVAATKPTIANGSIAPGTFQADLALLLGGPVRVAMEGSIRMPASGGDYVYSFSTAGGIARASDTTTQLGANLGGAFSFLVPATDNTGTCSSAPGCNFFVNGHFTGANPGTLGLSYNAMRPNNSLAIGGVALFGAGDTRPEAPPGPASGDYSNQYLMHLTYANFDVQQRSTVTYSNEGVITAWTRDNGSRNTVRHAGPVEESGSIHNVIGWSRWLDANNYADGDPKLPNTGAHFVTGTPATNLPTTGTVEYALIGHTRPTDRAGNLAPGTFAGSLAVDFATRKVGVDFDVAIGDYGWNLRTAGGSANPNNGGYNVTASNAFANNALIAGTTAASCTTTCSAMVYGQLFGNGASHAGAGFTISDAGAGSLIVSGVGAFGRP